MLGKNAKECVRFKAKSVNKRKRGSRPCNGPGCWGGILLSPPGGILPKKGDVRPLTGEKPGSFREQLHLGKWVEKGETHDRRARNRILCGVGGGGVTFWQSKEGCQGPKKPRFELKISKYSGEINREKKKREKYIYIRETRMLVGTGRETEIIWPRKRGRTAVKR